MSRTHLSRHLSRHRRRRIVVAAIATLGLAATAVPAATAHDGSHEGSEAGAQETRSEAPEQLCPPGVQRKLDRAQDRFGAGCSIAGGDLAALDDSDTVLAPGETASSPNMRLIANIPKYGAFEPETSYSSDLAFQGNYAYAGNYNGFTVYDIKKAKRPKAVTQVVCPGAQNDVSVWKDLLILSVDSSRNDDSCASTSQSASQESSWEGVRVFDISKPATPRYVAAVETPCGSHTHTLAPSKNGKDLFVYVSSYGPNAAFPDCQPPHDRISVVKVPAKKPETAFLAGTPVLFPEGGNPGNNGSSTTSGCHDITAYPAKDIAAGACMGDGVVMDISDREHPVVTETVRDTENFAFWHSATFNNAGSKVVFTDELGGGGGPTCNPTVGPHKGADAIYDLTGGELEFASYYKMPRTQANTENCVAHNGSLIPVKGKDLMVQAWYQGGVSVIDFTDSANPEEFAWFDRGAISDERLVLGGSWSAYWYNGHIYSNDIQRGLEVFELKDKRVKGAKKFDTFNPQSQPSYKG